MLPNLSLLKQVRHKSKCEEEEGVVNAALPPPTPFTPSLPEILQVEEHLPVCAHLSDVVFVKWKGMEGDSRLVQGSRTSMAELEITPGICTKGSVEEESENNDVEAVCLQPTPTTQLLVRRAVHPKQIKHHHHGECSCILWTTAGLVNPASTHSLQMHHTLRWHRRLDLQCMDLTLPDGGMLPDTVVPTGGRRSSGR